MTCQHFSSRYYSQHNINPLLIDKCLQQMIINQKYNTLIGKLAGWLGGPLHVASVRTDLCRLAVFTGQMTFLMPNKQVSKLI